MNRNIHRIEKILDDFNIVNYTINSDETVDVDGSVNLILATNQYTKIDFTSFTEIILTVPEGTQLKVHDIDGPCTFNLWRIS